MPFKPEFLRAIERLKFPKGEVQNFFEQFKAGFQSQAAAPQEEIHEMSDEFLEKFVEPIVNLNELIYILGVAPEFLQEHQGKLIELKIQQLKKQGSNDEELINYVYQLQPNQLQQFIHSFSSSTGTNDSARFILYIALYRLIDENKTNITELNSLIPVIRNSDIFDDFETFEFTHQGELKKVYALLAQLTENPEELIINIDKASELHEFFHKIRIGHKSLKDYVNQLKTNVINDLFFLRTQMELKQYTTDETERRLLKIKMLQEMQNPKYQAPELVEKVAPDGKVRKEEEIVREKNALISTFLFETEQKSLSTSKVQTTTSRQPKDKTPKTPTPEMLIPTPEMLKMHECYLIMHQPILEQITNLKSDIETQMGVLGALKYQKTRPLNKKTNLSKEIEEMQARLLTLQKLIIFRNFCGVRTHLNEKYTGSEKYDEYLNQLKTFETPYISGNSEEGYRITLFHITKDFLKFFHTAFDNSAKTYRINENELTHFTGAFISLDASERNLPIQSLTIQGKTFDELNTALTHSINQELFQNSFNFLFQNPPKMSELCTNEDDEKTLHHLAELFEVKELLLNASLDNQKLSSEIMQYLNPEYLLTSTNLKKDKQQLANFCQACYQLISQFELTDTQIQYKDLIITHSKSPQFQIAQPLIDKAKKIVEAYQIRIQTIKSVQECFEKMQEDDGSNENPIKLAKIIYHEQANSGADLEKDHNTENYIDSAKTIYRFIQRSFQGKSLLTDEEFSAQAKLIQHIFREVCGSDLETFKNCHFKISRNARNCTVHLPSNSLWNITVPDNFPPFAISKSSGSLDIHLTPGGSRGNIAPIQGINTKLYPANSTKKQKNRFFTNCLPLGSGQYGTVKIHFNVLTNCPIAKKKVAITPAEITSIPVKSQTEVVTLAGKKKTSAKTGQKSAATAAAAPETRPEKLISPFTDAAINDPMLYLYTHRFDNSTEVENWINQEKSKIDGEKTLTGVLRSSKDTENSKPTEQGLYKVQTFETLTMDQVLAKGIPLSSFSKNQFSVYGKQDPRYHDPVQRFQTDSETFDDKRFSEDTENMAFLAMAIVKESQNYLNAGFTHNDIKPENLLFQHNPTNPQKYNVSFIDNATAGFKSKTLSISETTSQPDDKFAAQTLGCAPNVLNQTDNKWTHPDGRYFEFNNGQYTYGRNPVLSILGGDAQGTLSYLYDVRKISSDPQTKLTSDDQTLDNWALMTMIFGVCHRQSYFDLSEDRKKLAPYKISDYIKIEKKATGKEVLAPDEKFNELFGQDIPEEMMYIPSNSTEGEPLHFYKRLLKIKELNSKLSEKIDPILKTIENAITNKTPPTKEKLLELLQKTLQVVDEFQKQQNAQYEEIQRKSLCFEKIYTDLSTEFTNSKLKAYDSKERKKYLEILCLYPQTAEQKAKACQLLESIEIETILNPPFEELLAEILSAHQTEIFESIIQKCTVNDKPTLIQRIENYDLINIALENKIDVSCLIDKIAPQDLIKENSYDKRLKTTYNALELAVLTQTKEWFKNLQQNDKIPQNERISSAIDLAAERHFIEIFKILYLNLLNKENYPLPYLSLFQTPEGSALFKEDGILKDKPPTKNLYSIALAAAQAQNFDGLNFLARKWAGEYPTDSLEISLLGAILKSTDPEKHLHDFLSQLPDDPCSKFLSNEIKEPYNAFTKFSEEHPVLAPRIATQIFEKLSPDDYEEFITQMVNAGVDNFSDADRDKIFEKIDKLENLENKIKLLQSICAINSFTLKAQEIIGSLTPTAFAHPERQKIEMAPLYALMKEYQSQKISSQQMRSELEQIIQTLREQISQAPIGENLQKLSTLISENPQNLTPELSEIIQIISNFLNKPDKNQLNDSLKRIDANIQRKEEKITQLREELKKSNSDNKSIEHELETAHKNNTKLEEQVQANQRIVTNLNTLIDNLSTSKLGEDRNSFIEPIHQTLVACLQGHADDGDLTKTLGLLLSDKEKHLQQLLTEAQNKHEASSAEITERIKSLAGALQEAQRKNETQNEQLNQNQKKIKGQDAKIIQLEESLLTSTTEKDELKKQLDAKENRIVEVNSKNEQLRNEAARRTGEIDTKDESIVALTNKNQQLARDLETTTTTIKDLQDTLSQKDIEIGNLKKQNAEIVFELEQLKVSYQALQVNLNTLTLENAVLKDAESQLQKIKESLSQDASISTRIPEQIKALLGENASLRNGLQSVKQKLNIADNQAISTENIFHVILEQLNENTRLKAQVNLQEENIRRILAENTQQLDTLKLASEKEIGVQKALVTDTNSKYNRLEQSLTEKTEELGKQSTELETIRKELQTLKEQQPQLETLQMRIEELSTQLVNRNDELKKMRTTSAQPSEMEQQYIEQISDLQRTISELKENLKETTSQLKCETTERIFAHLEKASLFRDNLGQKLLEIEETPSPITNIETSTPSDNPIFNLTNRFKEILDELDEQYKNLQGYLDDLIKSRAPNLDTGNSNSNQFDAMYNYDDDFSTPSDQTHLSDITTNKNQPQKLSNTTASTQTDNLSLQQENSDLKLALLTLRNETLQSKLKKLETTQTEEKQKNLQENQALQLQNTELRHQVGEMQKQLELQKTEQSKVSKELKQSKLNNRSSSTNQSHIATKKQKQELKPKYTAVDLDVDDDFSSSRDVRVKQFSQFKKNLQDSKITIDNAPNPKSLMESLSDQKLHNVTNMDPQNSVFLAHNGDSRFRNVDDESHIDDDESHNEIDDIDIDNEPEIDNLSVHRSANPTVDDQELSTSIIYAYPADDVRCPLNPEQAINKTQIQLNKDQSSELHDPKGLEVKDPNSKETYRISQTDDVTRAFIPEGKNIDNKESLALTIMNIVENVISKGKYLNIKTEDVFMATIAHNYAMFLKEKIRLEIEYRKPKNIKWDAPKNLEQIHEASELFTKLATNMNLENALRTSNIPWLEAAKNCCAPTVAVKISPKFS